ncbi:MAG: DUF4236 domain-containing protein [Desulfuromonadales bacterium]|nr:DUF4236 domain-containing protein [Desulfuromonadales bacterium]
MALRFRRSVKIAPGIRMNLGKRGVSLSAGVRGASVTYGRGGLYGNAGLPGSGLSYRGKIAGGSASRARSAGQRQTPTVDTSVGVKLSLQDDGTVEILDEDGLPLPAKHLKLLKEQKRDFIREWLSEQCDNWNQGIDSILNLHLATPPADLQIAYELVAFDIAQPRKPQPKSAGFWGKIFKSKQQKVDRENQAAEQKFKGEFMAWRGSKAEYESKELERRELIEKRRFQAPDGMQDFLSAVFSDIEWSRETLVSFEVSDSGKFVCLDIDLPEIEDMPTEQATVAARGFKLNIKARSDTQRRKEYMKHIHAILFRLIGEAFVALPTVETVMASGFSQRPHKQTGQINDEYLLSLKVSRTQWNQINFSNLEVLDLPECFEMFEHRRKMTKTGVFTAIEPLEEGH